MSQSREITPLEHTKNVITKMEGQFAKALPRQIPSQRFTRTVMTAVSDPRMADMINKQQLDTASLLSACTKAAQDGLLLDNREAALLTFWSGKEKINKAQYIPMVAGLMKKARNSGEIVSISANVVFEGDDFDQWIDEKGVHFTYRPAKDASKRGKPIKVFALGITKDGGSQLEILELADINAIAGHSKNADQYSPEKGQWFQEWWKKAAIRRVCKYLPSSSELDRLFEHDNENYDLGDAPEAAVVAQEQPKQQNRPDTKAAMMQRNSASQEPEDAVYTDIPHQPAPPADDEFPI